ncbi:dephospho-CoA kinase [Bacillus idriensis]|uniref:Dephospho-CoA kinase n=1 Tax=Metabacillus idriensis TaxID=324768 RepID=A0A6I2MBM0_9BACI|nr:dephospho-CoA kinase [Metabacillus idriensis]MRX54682.1 dephospho-CoA kinase [Metabacillus idriensis]
MENTDIKIATCGRLRSGKTTAEQYLCAIHDFTPFAFADPLKYSFYNLFPQYRSQPKPRALLQKYGEDMCAIDPHVWIRPTFESIKRTTGIAAIEGRTPRILITDLRKQTELDEVRRQGFTVIRITAPEELRIKRAREAGDDFNVEDLTHPTEISVDGFDCDYEVSNEGDSFDLYAQLNRIISKLEADK